MLVFGAREMNYEFLSVDDHPLLREGIAMVINSQADMVTVAV